MLWGIFLLVHLCCGQKADEMELGKLTRGVPSITEDAYAIVRALPLLGWIDIEDIPRLEYTLPTDWHYKGGVEARTCLSLES